MCGMLCSRKGIPDGVLTAVRRKSRNDGPSPRDATRPSLRLASVCAAGGAHGDRRALWQLPGLPHSPLAAIEGPLRRQKIRLTKDSASRFLAWSGGSAVPRPSDTGFPEFGRVAPNGTPRAELVGLGMSRPLDETGFSTASIRWKAGLSGRLPSALRCRGGCAETGRAAECHGTRTADGRRHGRRRFKKRIAHAKAFLSTSALLSGDRCRYRFFCSSD